MIIKYINFIQTFQTLLQKPNVSKTWWLVIRSAFLNQKQYGSFFLKEKNKKKKQQQQQQLEYQNENWKPCWSTFWNEKKYPVSFRHSSSKFWNIYILSTKTKYSVGNCILNYDNVSHYTALSVGPLLAQKESVQTSIILLMYDIPIVLIEHAIIRTWSVDSQLLLQQIP